MNDLTVLKKFAKRYAEAWCSQDPDKVAAFFVERGSISINDGPPAVGRAAIAREAQAFMITFRDMVVTFDKLEPRGDTTAFHWTLTGTNTGPGGTGNRVRISGYELVEDRQRRSNRRFVRPFRQGGVRTSAQARSRRR